MFQFFSSNNRGMVIEKESLYFSVVVILKKIIDVVDKLATIRKNNFTVFDERLVPIK
jgi:hypothetical protein